MKKILITLLLLVAWTHSVLAYPDVYSKITENVNTDIIQVINDPSPVTYEDETPSQSPVTYSVYNLYKQEYSQVESALAQYGWKRMPGHWYFALNVATLDADGRTVLYERTSPFDANVNELLYILYYYDQNKPNIPPNQTAFCFELRLVPKDGSQETLNRLYDQFYARIKNSCPPKFVFDDTYVNSSYAEKGCICGYDITGEGCVGPGWGHDENYIYLEKRNDCVVIDTTVSGYMYMRWPDNNMLLGYDHSEPQPMAGPPDRSHPVFETYMKNDDISSGGVVMRTGGELYSKNDYPFYVHKVGREEVENGTPVD